MLDVEVIPELALRCGSWELVLGMPLQLAIEIIRKQDNVISEVDFLYNNKYPMSYNIILNLRRNGLQLYFDPKCQRLSLIKVVDMSKIFLSYCCQYFNSPNVVPTVQEIIRIFGSTKRLTYDKPRGEYRLCYRGVTFVLTLPKGGVAPSLLSSSPTGAVDPMYSFFDSHLVASRLYIFLGQSVEDAKLPLQMPVSCFLGNILLERLLVIRDGQLTKRFVFHLIYQELWGHVTQEPILQHYSASISFGDSVQDVLSALGSPSRIFYKTEDKMKIHLPQPYRYTRQRHSNFFYNYFTLGVDVLFDGRTQTVITLVLHTNQPADYTFNMYYRCMFEIEMEDSTLDGNCPFLITPFVKWPEICSLLKGSVDDEPVVIHRETKLRRNPFGHTHAYGYCDMIFEVLPLSGYLSSVTIYSLPRVSSVQF